MPSPTQREGSIQSFRGSKQKSEVEMKHDHSRPWVSFHGGHSHWVDGRDTVAAIAQAAADRQFRSFGFSEHFTIPPHDDFSPDGIQIDVPDRTQWIAEYVTSVRDAKAQLAGELSILLGAEVEYIVGAEAWTREQLSPWAFEYLVGSVHYVRYGDCDICIDWDRPRIDRALELAGSAEQLQLHYYDHVLELLDWRQTHVLGHLDLIKMLLSPEERVVTSAIRLKVQEVLETLRDQGVAMDVNPRGLVKSCREIYPADWILIEAGKIGVLPALGDDSHAVEEVGARLDKAVAALRRCGFGQMALVHPGGALETVALP